MSALQISRDICSVDGGLVERISIGLHARTGLLRTMLPGRVPSESILNASQ